MTDSIPPRLAQLLVKVLLPVLGSLLLGAIAASIELYGSVTALTTEVVGLRRDVTRLEERIDQIDAARFTSVYPPR